MKRILCVFAHPDDESFGPGGTIALWAKQGYEIHLLCATSGEHGTSHLTGDLGKIREEELRIASDILGIQKVELLNYKDGQISNQDLPAMSEKIAEKINDFKPDILLTFDLNGISGHLDHIAVASATTSAFLKTKIPKELYYHTLLYDSSQETREYFVYFPPGKKLSEIDEVIDTTEVHETEIAAIKTHKSQEQDVKQILQIIEKSGSKEYFLVKKQG